MDEWFSSLKVGDPVAVCSWNHKLKYVAPVERITPSGIVVVRGVLYNKNAIERGASYMCAKYIRKPTDKDVE